MRIDSRIPTPSNLHTLVNVSGIGELRLADSIEATEVLFHTVAGDRVSFQRGDE
jgi:hypothetical protein